MVLKNKKTVEGFSRQTYKRKLEETWRDWVSKLNSRLSFYYHLPAVEKCLDKSLDMSTGGFQIETLLHRNFIT